MTHPIIYASSAALGGMSLTLGMLHGMQVTDRTAEIKAIGEILQGVALILSPILLAWIAYKVQQAKTLADEAKKKIDDLGPVVAKIDAHVNSDKTKDLGTITAQAQQLDLQREMIEELKKAAALLAQAKATTDLSNAIAQAAVAGATTPAVAPNTAPTPQTATIATVTDAAKTIAEAVPQLDSIEQTGEATHAIVSKDLQKP